MAPCAALSVVGITVTEVEVQLNIILTAVSVAGTAIAEVGVIAVASELSAVATLLAEVLTLIANALNCLSAEVLLLPTIVRRLFFFFSRTT